MNQNLSAGTTRSAGRTSVLRLTMLALFTALVALLQLALGAVKIGPTSFTFVLVPIVLGAILLGKWAGGFLGLVFGAITLACGITGTDGFTALLFNAQPVFTSVICLVKGAAAGFLAGLVYQLVRGNAPETGVRSFVASLLASVTAPVVNTGLFILGGLTLVRGTLEANLAVFGWTSDSVLLFLVIGCAGINFLAEFAANLILSPAIHRIILAVGSVLPKAKH